MATSTASSTQPSGPGSHVTEVDAFTLRMERDPLLRSTVVAVARFDRAPEWERFRHRVDAATRLAPTFRSKLVASPLGLAPPRWLIDPDFDLDWHLHRLRLPEGGGFAAVLELARTTGMAAFDPDRPRWEMTLMEGLPDGGAALVIKVHHALTDGIGGIQIAAHVVDLDRDTIDDRPLPAAPEPESHGGIEAILEAVGYDVRAAIDLGRGLVTALPGATLEALRDPGRAVGQAVATTASLARMVRPITATRSPLMTGRRLQWHYDVLDVSLSAMKAAAATVDGTLNDAFVAAVGGGFHRYHDQHCAAVEELRVTMPISLRTDDDEEGGNHIGLVRFDVPVAHRDPRVRMRDVGKACRAQRREPSLAYTNQVAAVLNLLPVSAVGGMLRHVDLLASNVPGFPFDVFAAGARLVSFHAFGPTIGASANVTLMSYGDVCNIGVNTDTGAVPDPGLLMACLRDSFDEVTAVGRSRPRTGSRSRTTKT